MNVETDVQEGERSEISEALAYYRARNKGRKKFAPDPLIDAFDGKPRFAPLADLASERNRTQSGMEFQIGMDLSKQAAAKRHYAESGYTPEEVLHANDISHKKKAFRKEQATRRAMEKEYAKIDAGQDWNAYEVTRAEEEYSEAKGRADYVRERIRSASPRVLELAKKLREIVELERRAKRWINLSERQLNCAVFGRIYPCDNDKCQSVFYTPFNCKARYCSHCAKGNHQRLFKKYLRWEKPIEQFISENPLYNIRCITVTTRTTSQEMPTREAPRKFKRDFYKLMGAINERLADEYGWKNSRQLTGVVYCMEFGDKKTDAHPYGNNNLHCHAIFIGPFIEQSWLENKWREIRNNGDYRVDIREAQPDTKNGQSAYAAALSWTLEYTGKYASASSAERAVQLEQAFEGCRRVEALGLFRTLKPEEEEVPASVRCPSCDIGFLTPNYDCGWIPVVELERLGSRKLEDVTRERGKPAERIAAAIALYAGEG